MKNLLSNILILLIICLNLWTVQYVEGKEIPAPDVFQSSTVMRSAEMLPEAVAGRSVLVDLDLLKQVVRDQRINLNLFDTVSFVGVTERVDRRSDNQITLFGQLQELVGSSFIIVVEKDVAVGVIRTNVPNELYQLRYLGGGVHQILLIDPTLYPPEEDPIPDDLPSISSTGLSSEPVDQELSRKIGTLDNGCSPPQPVFDIILPYTHLARQAMGGTDAAVAQCQLAVAVTNEAYTNSLVYARMRLVHCWEVNYNEPGGMSDWLEWVFTNTAVHDTRDAYAADFVSMLVSGGSGMGKCDADASRAYSIVRWERAVNTWTLGHETGHNIGCAHNREDVDVCDGIYPYSYGWHFLGDSGTEWGTVMSYIGSRIAHYSNPDVDSDGQPTGVPVGQVNESHNALTIGQRALTVESFRTSRFEVWVDFDWEHYQRGTYVEPYSMLAYGIDALVDSPHASEEPTVWIKASSTNETITIDKPMIIRACGGTATIGASL